MHPYDNHKSNLLGVASALWYHGYSVFMFDFRSFAANPKTRQSIGYFEQFDANAAINYVKNNHYLNPNVAEDDIHRKRQIVLMGASMGGACAICASDKFKDERLISACVTDCTFSSLREICKYRIGIASAYWYPVGLLDHVVNIMDRMNQFFYGYSVDDVNPIDIVSDDSFNIPLLLLHSECDAAVPFSHSQKLYKNCKSKIKNLYCIKSGDHCGGFYISPSLYIKYLCQWVDDVLDHEILERKHEMNQRQALIQDANKEENEQTTNVVINNEFIMFDTQDDIGLEDEDHIPKQTDSIANNNNDDNVEDEKEEIALNENSKVIIEGTNNSRSSKPNPTINVPNGAGNDQQPSSSSSSSFMSYFGGFLGKK